jgi:hypothetical protein
MNGRHRVDGCLMCFRPLSVALLFKPESLDTERILHMFELE